MSKKNRGNSKLDILLKEGASNIKKTPNTMDKALASTAHRLLRETIQFAKATSTLNVADQYRQSGFILLAPQDEKKALERLKGPSKLLSRKSKPKKKKKTAKK